jgi:hypothetical protein
MKFETLDEFLEYHHKLIHDICEKSVENHVVIAKLAFELWDQARLFANRSYVTLAFDCCYIISNATGNKVSISLLKNISGDLLDGRRVRAMTTSSRKRWFMTQKGKDAIMQILQDQELYDDVTSNWTEEE